MKIKELSNLLPTVVRGRQTALKKSPKDLRLWGKDRESRWGHSLNLFPQTAVHRLALIWGRERKGSSDPITYK